MISRHIDLLGILHMIWGGLGLLLGVSVLLLAGGAVAIAAAVRSHEPDLAAAFTAVALTAAAIVLLVGGAASLWAGAGLRRHRPSARIAALGLALLNLFLLPFGTALGIYAFWVLLGHEARARFEPPRPAGTRPAGT